MVLKISGGSCAAGDIVICELPVGRADISMATGLPSAGINT
jgi:hypothetical protein